MTKYLLLPPILYLIIMCAFILSFFYFAISSENSTIEKINQCNEVGGVAIKDYKGAFRVCLDPGAVIKVE